jgi:hypothetical protein
MANWSLWLDDLADTVRPAPEGFVVAKSSAEAVRLVEDLGPPIFMDLDHDLGGEDTAMVFLKYLVLVTDSPPQYRVHSANGPAAANMVAYLNSWKKSLH